VLGSSGGRGVAGGSAIASFPTAVLIYASSLLLIYLLLSPITVFIPYYEFIYGRTYFILKNLYSSVTALFIIYLMVFSLIPRSTVCRYALIISSVTLIFTNYTYLLIYMRLFSITVTPLPLTMLLISNSTGSSVLSLDWGQLALITLTYVLRKPLSRLVHSLHL